MQQIDSSVRTKWCEVGDVPAAVVDSGEVFSVETTSFTEGYTAETMHTLGALSTERSRAPLTAPILVRGANPGDTLRVDVLDLAFTREFGCVLLSPGKGAFPDLVEQLVARAVPIDDDLVHFSEQVAIPTRKMLGKVSVAPAGERQLCNTPGAHGGNMDNRDITVGSSVYLRVNVEGAHLGVGDAHAVQGDGECGISAVEVEMRCLLRATVLPDLGLRAPVVRSPDAIMTMGAAPTLDGAADEALGEMHRLLQRHGSMAAQEAAMLISLVGDVHVSQLVNPLKSVKVRVPRRCLPLP